MSKFMDTLGDISGSESEVEQEEPNEKEEEAVKKKKVQAADPAPEELQALGLKGGPSILAVPEPQENSNPTWEWGKGGSEQQADDENHEQREHNREAAGVGLEEKARQQRLIMEKAKQAREEAWQEQQRIAAEKRLTWKQKEKRKRELGQAKGGKGNYVEEEKRVAREFGIYSGFDS